MLRSWTTLVLLTGLLAGCARTLDGDYCDIAVPHLLGGEATIKWLVANDRQLLVDTIIHNETYERLCGESHAD